MLRFDTEKQNGLRNPAVCHQCGWDTPSGKSADTPLCVLCSAAGDLLSCDPSQWALFYAPGISQAMINHLLRVSAYVQSGHFLPNSEPVAAAGKTVHQQMLQAADVLDEAVTQRSGSSLFDILRVLSASKREALEPSLRIVPKDLSILLPEISTEPGKLFSGYSLTFLQSSNWFEGELVDLAEECK